MSHISKIKVEIKDLQALHQACEDLGLVFNEGQNTYKWYGQPKRCDHAISLKNNSRAYEIGVIDKKDGTYEFEFDFWQGGYGIQDAVGANCDLLKNTYTNHAAYNAAETFANNNGWSVSREYVEETGETKIKLRQY